jgi:hypothetical protein
MKSVKATDMLLTQMNTKDKDIKTKPFIKTLHTTLACLVATSAFALDDRLENPQPENEPDPKTPDKPQVVELPDLVPMGLDLTYISENSFRFYRAKITVANFGKADAGEFFCHVGYQVITTTDPVKYPVGSKQYGGMYLKFDGLKVMEIADWGGNPYAGFDVALPVEVTGAELFLVVDHHYDWNSADQDWSNDAGFELTGDIKESNENNNVLGGVYRYCYEYQDPSKTVSVPKNITLKPKTRG